jgi:translocation and assembly module TamB
LTPDIEPVPQPDAPRRRSHRWVWWAVGVLLVVVLAVVGGLAWLLATTRGAQFALDTGLEHSGGTGRVEGVQGTLLDGLTIEHLQFANPTLDVSGDKLRITVNWTALRNRRVQIIELAAQRLAINTISATDDTPSTGFPTSIGIPVEVDVERLQVGTLDIAQNGAALPVSISELDASLAARLDGYRLHVNRIKVSGADADAALRGTINLGASQPFDIQGELDSQVRQGERRFTVHTTATGSLGDLQLALRGEGSGVSVDAMARAGVIDGGFPLRGLRLSLRGVDPAAWVASAPKADIEIGSDLSVVTAEPGGGPRLQGPLWIHNAAPGTWDAGAVPVEDVRATLSLPLQPVNAAQLTDVVIQLPGAGSVKGNVDWRRQGTPDAPVDRVVGRLVLADVDAAKLYAAAVPTKLSGPVSFDADPSRQIVDVDLREQGNKTPLALRASARLENDVVDVSQAVLSAGEARATASGRLELSGARKFAAKLALKDFDPAHWVPGLAMPPASLTAQADVDGTLSPALAGSARVAIDPASRWNRRPLSGKISTRFTDTTLSNLMAGLDIADNRIAVEGSVGGDRDRLGFDLQMPTLEALWPGLGGKLAAKGQVVGNLKTPVVDTTLDGSRLKLPGGVALDKLHGKVTLGKTGQRLAIAQAPVSADVKIEGLSATSAPQAVVSKASLVVSGTMAKHEGTVDAEIVPAPPQTERAQIRTSFNGGWGPGAKGQPNAAQVGWRGTVSMLDARRKPLAVALTRPVSIVYLPDARAPGWQWEVGATGVRLTLPDAEPSVIEHAGSRGGAGRWESKGRITGLAWSPDLMTAWFGDDGVRKKATTAAPVADRRILVDGEWDLRFADALAGTARLGRRSGDIWIPGDPPVPLGLSALLADFRAEPTRTPGHSRLTAQLDLAGERIGTIKGNGSAEIIASGGNLALDESKPAEANLNLDVKDLAWLSLFTGDALEVGGRMAGDVRVRREAGAWGARGTLRGEGLRVVRIDDGVRLLDGTLQARLVDDRIVIDSLRFPAVMRALPRDDRIVAWMHSADAKAGSLLITGEWMLTGATGKAKVVAKQFPVVQRADRFIAISGEIDVDAAPRRMRISGNTSIDAGWVFLGTSSPATLDADVVIRHRTGEAPVRGNSTGVSIDVSVDLGNRFYLRGMGIDTALGGKLRVLGEGSNLRANGSVRTIGGQYAAYGQSLTIRRGVITFQGPLDDPLLDIMALRIGPAVQAGVQVGGSARHPRITLVSEPAVSDVEKLSWLLLGRGPDDAGGADAGLLLSAATALLGDKDGVPLARQLHVDEIGIRSGNVGSSRGLLPERTVAGDSTSSTSDLATEFFIVGKRISDSVYASYEQALAGREGVVRLSYQISRRLQLVGRGGTINGVDLMYTVLFGD